jgi:hypothetical protein
LMKMTCLNRLAQRVGQNRQILPHFTRTLALVQQSLRLGLHFRSEKVVLKTNRLYTYMLVFVLLFPK